MRERAGSSAAPVRPWRPAALLRLVARCARGGTAARAGHDPELLPLIIETQRDIIAAGADLEAVMELVLSRSQRLTGADGAMVNLVEGDELLTRAASGIAEPAVGRRRPLARTVARHAIEGGTPLLVTDCETDPRINRELQRFIGDKSLICVPLFHGADVIGALNVMSSSETRLTERHRETMEMLSVMLSAAVSQAAEFEARRGQAEAYGRFRTLFEGAAIGIARSGADERAADANPALAELLGYSAAELAEMSFREYTHPDDVEQSAALYAEMMAGERDAYQLELRFVRKDGAEVWGQITAVLERDAEGRPACAVTMVENITQRKVAESALMAQSRLNEYQAVHDALTDLPNRTLFRRRIQHAVAEAERDGESVAVVIMDLDRFKEVNDSIGHHAGDALLIEVARRVEGALQTSDTVARLGGDEFGLLLPAANGMSGIATVLERVREAVEAPIVFHDLPLAIAASMGVALYPQDGCDVETLLRHADVAMYAAKRADTAYAAYDTSHNQSDPERLTLVADLRRALQEHELVLHYQPKAGLASGSVDSVEALVRWNHPERGMVYPDAFIPLAQETGLIRPLTRYVLEEAIRQCRAWQATGLMLSVSVNLSARNLMDAEFPDQVERLLAESALDPAMLELEITETTMLSDGMRTKAALDRLAALGIRISIDDFGTGYSSLAYLRQLPISEIKIDRSFVMNMDTCEDDAVIVRSTIDLGRNLGLTVVAEGVENEAVWTQLRRLGCTAAQGYYLTRPVPADGLESWLCERDGRPAPRRAA